MNEKIKFPNYHPDGSFHFFAIYRLEESSEIETSKLEYWISEWIKINSPWTREWSSGNTEVLNFFSAFSSFPRVASTNDELVALSFSGLKNAEYWKDWFVKLSSALIEDHPIINELVSCENDLTL